MIPIVTPAEMAAIDAAAPEPVEELIERAGAAVARTAVAMLGGTYGRRIVVLAGKGNNGADGRAAARRLARRGAHVRVLDVATAQAVLPSADLVIDAAFGTGFRGEWSAPAHRAGAVLAVDIPSGVSGLDGTAAGRLLVADRTVTFAALKPGLLLGAGPAAAGEIDVVDIGLEVSAARAHLVTDGDLAAWVPARPADSHKWRAAVWVVAGSPGMTGAAHLVAGAALRSGAGYVRLSVPGGSDTAGPLEAVRTPIGRDLVVAGDEVGRFGALVVGPGLGRAAGVDLAVARFAASVTRPLVIDGDGLAVLGRDASRVARGRAAVTVLTPHDGEFEMLTGRRPGVDRLAEARWLAADTGAVVLLKGPSTVVAAPDGRVLVAAAGDARLATAGTGDVLAGIIAAFLARGVAPLEAAAAAAHLHGCAAALGPEIGMVASDLLHLVPVALAGLGPREAR